MSMHKTDDQHLFAVYVANLFEKQAIQAGSLIVIADQDVAHRIITVLRMQIGDEVQLFDNKKNYLCTITDIKKAKALTVKIISIASNTRPNLEITAVLPILKKESLEEVIYSLTEIGVTAIQLVITHKSQKQLTDKELQRLHKMKVAAAEQSKQFAMPAIASPIVLEKFCTQWDGADPALLFDPSGKPALEVITSLKQQKVQKIFFALGPEGGLTNDEIQRLIQRGFISCKLTHTVLRALQAAALGAGLLASLL